MRTTSSLFSVALWALSACTPSPEAPSRDTRGTTFVSTPAQVVSPTPGIVEHTDIKMGMPFKIKLYQVKDQSHAREAIETAFKAIAMVENKMSEWQPGSEVSQINRSAGHNRVTLSPMTFEVLQAAYSLAMRSEVHSIQPGHRFGASGRLSLIPQNCHRHHRSKRLSH